MEICAEVDLSCGDGRVSTMTIIMAQNCLEFCFFFIFHFKHFQGIDRHLTIDFCFSLHFVVYVSPQYGVEKH